MIICACIPAFLWGFRLLSERKKLSQELIRCHVVANSDAEQDQNVKLQIRDAVLDSIREDLRQANDMKAARQYLRENLSKIKEIADETLHLAGFSESVEVSLCQEEFDTRIYDTFTLPAGVYESLRIVIGQGQGKNWWCVTFPDLCLSGTTDGFSAAAACAGFSAHLIQTLSNAEEYEVRFFLLDALGHLENILHTSK